MHRFKVLGNLARYHMAVAAMVTNSQFSGARLTTDTIFKAAATSEEPLLNLPSLKSACQTVQQHASMTL